MAKAPSFPQNVDIFLGGPSQSFGLYWFFGVKFHSPIDFTRKDESPNPAKAIVSFDKRCFKEARLSRESTRT